jgi:hypothetical protein
MSRRKVFLYVIVSLIVVAVLVAGGYAIYRLGYNHGAEGTCSLTLERRWMPDFDRRSTPDLWHWRGHVSLPFAFIIPRLISGLIFLAFLALAVYGGIKLLRPDSRTGRQILESQSPQPEPPVEDSLPAE